MGFNRENETSSAVLSIVKFHLMQVQLLQLSLEIKKSYGASLLYVLSLNISTFMVLM